MVLQQGGRRGRGKVVREERGEGVRSVETEQQKDGKQPGIRGGQPIVNRTSNLYPSPPPVLPPSQPSS